MRSLLLLAFLVGCGQIPSAPIEDEPPPPDTGGEIPDPGGQIERARVVFVTSEFLEGGFGGLAGADSICQEHARFGELRGTFKAWLADARESPSTRMTRGKGEYRRTDGVVVAKNWDDLVDGTLEAPIDHDESGFPADDSLVCAGDSVWSNIAVGGVRRANATDCNGWTSSLASATGVQGSFRSSGQRWTHNTCAPAACDELMAIYCVEQ